MIQQLARPLSVPWPVAVAAAIAALGLYLVGFDQGHALALFQGDTAYQLNFIHELVHDARHAAGFPCH